MNTESEILALIGEIQGSAYRGGLFITHDCGGVAEIADRVAVMQQGRLVEFGEARQVLNAPRHPYTRSLLAAVPSLPPRVRPPVLSAPPVLSVRRLCAP